jgi:hypothetical protein
MAQGGRAVLPIPVLRRHQGTAVTGAGILQHTVDHRTLALAPQQHLGRLLKPGVGHSAHGLAAFTAASLTSCALASSVVLLDAARAGQGLAAALVLASSLAILADVFPAPRERAARWPPTAR